MRTTRTLVEELGAVSGDAVDALGNLLQLGKARVCSFQARLLQVCSDVREGCHGAHAVEFCVPGARLCLVAACA